MEKAGKTSEFSNDPEFFDRVKASIDKDLENLKKIVDNVNQMRVETTYLESDLMTTLNSKTWENVSQLIGLTSGTMLDVDTATDDLNIKRES